MKSSFSRLDQQQKIAGAIAVSAFFTLITLLVWLASKENAIRVEAGKDIKGAVHMLEEAPNEGDFEIQYPAHVVPGDLVVARLSGVSTVTFPKMTTEVCNLVLSSVPWGAFRSAQVLTTRKTILVDKQSGGQEISAACSAWPHEEHVRIILGI